MFHDFAYPRGAMRSLWDVHFAVLRAAGRLVPTWKTVFDQLDVVIKNSDWVNQTARSLQNSGFQKIDCKFYTADTAAIVSAEKP